MIENAKAILFTRGIFQPGDFDGLQVRWCPLNGAHGMAPDRGRIYLDTAGKQYSAADLAVLLAHEMVHILQYRRMGSDQFKCEYSRNYVDCQGCQNENHPLEREAYIFQKNVSDQLAQQQALPSIPLSADADPGPVSQTEIPVRFCQTQMGTCSVPPTLAPMGTPCFCDSAFGQIPGSAF